MNAFTKKLTRVLLALIVAFAGLTMTGSPAFAAPVSIDLCALPGTLAPLPTTAPGITIPIWGFGIPSTPGDCNTATASLPGPLLQVTAGDIVTIHLINALDSASAPLHTVSLEIPGITFNAGSVSANTGGSVSITFTAGAPGTYLYQSSGDSGRQAAMGLYGELIVASATAGQAYDNISTAFNVQANLVLSQVDPAFNASPDTYNMDDYKATFWMINGKSYPDTDAITAPAGSKLLMRYVNAGFDNTTMQLLGLHEQVLARDAHLLNNPFIANAETIPAGGTEDVISTIPAAAPPAGFPLYNRQLHVTNGLAGDPFYNPGGMMTFIHP